MKMFDKIASFINDMGLNDDQKVKLEEFIGKFKSGIYVYPGVMKRYVGIDMIKAYEIMGLCFMQGIVKRMLQFQCPQCYMVVDTVELVLNDLPTNIECGFCSYTFNNPFDVGIVIYEVI